MDRPEDFGIDIPTTTFQDAFSEEVWSTTYRYHEDEIVDDTMHRVARFVASAEETELLQEEWEERFYDMLSGFKCTSGGRIYSNAGTEYKGTTLANCFVSPRNGPDIDSLLKILEDVSNQCQTLKSEGGWGQNFSWIRPRGSFIGGIGVESPGSVKYMEIYDKTSDVITSGAGTASKNKKAKGKIRKGAMMSILDSHHPDVIEFITAKQSPGRLTKFNMSVNCTDKFMQKVNNLTEMKKILVGLEASGDDASIEKLKLQIEEEDRWELIFPDTTHEMYAEVWDGDIEKWKKLGYPVVVHREVSALWLWNLMMESTYKRAEPGIVFLDRANYFDPANYLHRIIATNPCAEQVLPEGGVCNLGSINLTQFISDKFAGFNFDKLKKYVRYLVRFLDNINSLSNAPLPEYVDSMRNKRRVGVGILGWGSVLYMLKVRFGSEEAAKIRNELMSTISREAYMASIDLAEEKGMFSYCDPKKHVNGVFIKSLRLPEEYMKKCVTTGIRNSALLSIQPTGNSSIFANVVSGGLEPIFMPEYVRTVIVNNMPEEFSDVCPKWYEGEWHETDMFKFVTEGDEEILKGEHGGITYKIDKNRGLTKEVLCQDYGVRWLSARGEWEPDADWAVSTTNLSAEDHLSDMSGFARYLDSSLSKTINIPYEYEFESFKKIYLDAYNSGYIKGVTTYRAGTMTSVLSAKEEKCADSYDEEIILEDAKLGAKSPAEMNTITAEGKKWYLTVIKDDTLSRPVALFVHTNHHEKTATTNDAVDRLVALAVEKGIPHKWINGTLDKIKNDNNTTKVARCISLNLRHGVLIKNIVSTLDLVKDVFVGTFVFQIKKFLMSYVKDGEKVDNGASCPECGSNNMVYSEGCQKCGDCGNSKCG